MLTGRSNHIYNYGVINRENILILILNAWIHAYGWQKIKNKKSGSTMRGDKGTCDAQVSADSIKER